MNTKSCVYKVSIENDIPAEKRFYIKLTLYGSNHNLSRIFELGALDNGVYRAISGELKPKVYR